MLEIKKFIYKQSSPATISQGHKYGRCPENAVAGGNGTFLVADPPQVWVFFGNPKEKLPIRRVNVYKTIKENSQRKVTEKYVKKIMKNVIGQQVDKNEPEEEITKIIADATLA